MKRAWRVLEVLLVLSCGQVTCWYDIDMARVCLRPLLPWSPLQTNRDANLWEGPINSKTRSMRLHVSAIMGDPVFGRHALFQSRLWPARDMMRLWTWLFSERRLCTTNRILNAHIVLSVYAVLSVLSRLLVMVWFSKLSVTRFKWEAVDASLISFD